MGSLIELNTLSSSMGVNSAYYDAPADYLINLVERLSTIASPYVGAVEKVIVKQFPYQFASLTSYLKNNISPISQKLPLMGPVQVLILVIIYLTAVFGGKFIGQFFPKFEIKQFSLFHNFCMVVLSGYMCTSIIIQAYSDKYLLFSNPPNHSASGIPMAKIIWVFYISKLPEFVDTIIMVVKKNYRQISFLHVYHHCSIFVIWWLVTLMAPNGDAYFSAALNSFIHVIMYGYYLLSALGFKSISFVKKYITSSQMLQFSLNFIQASYNIIDYLYLRPEVHRQGGAYPIALSVLLFFYMISMLGLFANFFIQDRRREAANKRAKVAPKKVN